MKQHIAIIALLAAVGCDQAERPIAPRTRNAIAAKQFQTGPIQTLDQEMEQLARQFPGFGGVFVDSTGQLTAYFAGNAQTHSEASLHAVRALATRHRGELMGPTRVDTAHMIVKAAKFDFVELSRVAQSVRDNWRQGVSSLDINEAENMLVIGVKDSARAQRVIAALTAAGVSSDQYRVEVGSVTATSTTTLTSTTAVAGGVGYGNARVAGCSMGFTFQMYNSLTSEIGPDYYAASAAHCSYVDGGSDGSVGFSQPAGGRAMGHEILEPAPYTGGDCPSGSLCRSIDVSFYQISGAYADPSTTQTGDYQRGLIAWPNAGDSSFTFDHYAVIVSNYDGDNSSNHIGAVGVTSGRRESGTNGLRSTCVTISPDNSPYTVVCLNEAWIRSYPGDSGGSVYETYGVANSVRLSGVVSASHDWHWWNLTGEHFDHTTYYSPASRIGTAIGNYLGGIMVSWSNYTSCTANAPGSADVNCS